MKDFCPTTHTHTHTCIYIYIYMCVCVCVCERVFVCEYAHIDKDISPKTIFI